MRNTKKNENLRNPREKIHNDENLKTLIQNHEHHLNFRIPLEKHEKHENLRNLLETYENHENHRNHMKIMKIIKILEINVRIRKS